MLINIRELQNGHTVVEQEVSMTEEQVSDIGFCGTVICKAKIDRVQFQIYVHISYSCKVNQECARCLVAFEYPMEGTFDIVLRDKSILRKSESDEEDSFDYSFSERDNVIDMRQSLYEEVMLNLPVKPLCKTTCRGTLDYKESGSDSRETKEFIDPRWEALKKIKKQNKSNK